MAWGGRFCLGEMRKTEKIIRAGLRQAYMKKAMLLDSVVVLVLLSRFSFTFRFKIFSWHGFELMRS